MKITKRQLRRIIRETMELDLEVGDVILTGKFKNKRKIVKDFGKDDLGQPTINGTKALNFRIEKLMPKEKWSKKSKEALEFAEKVDEMKITKRQLRRIIKEALTSYESEIGAPSEFVEANWVPWLEERGLTADDLDDLAHHAGAPDRSWLEARPPSDGMIGPADLELWAKDQTAAREILSTRAGDYSSSPYGKKVNEGVVR
jgi:hypothetical protein